MTETAARLNDLLTSLPEIHQQHARDSATYRFYERTARECVAQMFGESSSTPQEFGPFGALNFPFHVMGAINSMDLFGLDELILFSFYWRNRERYRSAIDIGANIGLHSIVMQRCGFRVHAFEPDPKTAEVFKRNCQANRCESVELSAAAVSDHRGEAEFVRVLGNTTGSHLAGAKKAPYGALERFQVPLFPIDDAVADADFMKLDAEGHEKVILLAIKPERWKKLDAVVEVGSSENAEAIFAHLRRLNVHMFAQKSGWKSATKASDLPCSYKEGSLFLSMKEEMPW